MSGHRNSDLPAVDHFAGAADAARQLVDTLQQHLQARMTMDAAPTAEAGQLRVHGLAWFAAYARTLRTCADWAQRLAADGSFGELEHLLLTIGFGEYLMQMASGIAMSQDEIIRPVHYDAQDAAQQLLGKNAVRRIVDATLSSDLRGDLIALLQRRGLGDELGRDGLDPTHALIRDTFRRYADAHVMPHAQRWHRENALIPQTVIDSLSGMGAFGVTVPEAHGGLGLGAVAMCVMTEELSRGYIGVGSLGTRSEIACELIRVGGTEAQKQHYLPDIAAGRILPAAVFTEPGHGSDLANLQTRARRENDRYRVSGNKTWITHAARADLMTLLVRTGAADSGYRGLSMLLAEKPRGSDADPFPAAGMRGSEIEVLGYRGMREYEIAFDGFEVPASQLLGGEEGQGFKQLMTTFELARIQTAARALGVARNAFELGFAYAEERRQFGKPLIGFARVYGKLAGMLAELLMLRQLTYAAAQVKESGRRCDVEAGMAKLLAARLAWSAADNALQIHGGNGYAQEYPISRVLCDARILNIFEGAAEIQAQVIARSLLAPAA
jgi:(2S)-methylsuccinyl-CoA dehydrogenase